MLKVIDTLMHPIVAKKSRSCTPALAPPIRPKQCLESVKLRMGSISKPRPGPDQISTTILVLVYTG